MVKSASEQQIRQALEEVRHPEINSTLAKLGMLKDILVENNKVSFTRAFPVTGIPTQVKDYLINSLRQALADIDARLEVEINLAEMSSGERLKFFTMAREGWID
jgi:metal-sulfur cluster biosynthetic enzyme